MTEMLSSGSEESQSDDSQETGHREPEKGDSPNPKMGTITFGELLKRAKEMGLNFVSAYDEPHFVEYSKATDSKDTVKIKLDQEYWNLHRVSVENRVDIAHVLIARGADVDARSPYDRTPLHYAARKNSLDVARLLLDHGAEVDARCNQDRTPFFWAKSLGATSLLIEYGAKPVETDTPVLTTPRPTGSSDPSATTWEVLMIPKKPRRMIRKDSSQDSSADPQQQAQE